MSTSISRSLPRDLTLLRHGAGAAGRALGNIAQGMKIDFKLGEGSAEGVAVHAQFTRGTALVALILFQYGQDEALLKLAHGFRIKNPAVMHLQDEGF